MHLMGRLVNHFFVRCEIGAEVKYAVRSETGGILLRDTEYYIDDDRYAAHALRDEVVILHPEAKVIVDCRQGWSD
ncbi:MAG: hypothetical protein RI911_641 [Candidatus Parcubacteria bacterium]